jgi:hypothetical protein
MEAFLGSEMGEESVARELELDMCHSSVPKSCRISS